MAKTVLKGFKESGKLLEALARQAEESQLREHSRAGGELLAKEIQTNADRIDPSGELGQSIGVLDDPDEPGGVLVTA